MGRLARAVHCWGTGLIPQVPLDDKRMYPIYAKCVEVGLPIIVYAGVPGPRIPMAPQHPMQLDEVCWFFPELRSSTRHGAEPWTELMVKLLLKWPGLHYSTSAFAPKYYPEDIIEFANSRGADKVIYAGYYAAALSLDRIFAELPVASASATTSGRSSSARTRSGSSASSRQEVPAVAVEVARGRDRLAPRGAEGAGGHADRHDRHRLDPLGELDDPAHVVGGEGGQRGQGGAVAEGTCGEQQVLHGREDRRGEVAPPAAGRVAGHDHDDGCGAEAGLGRLVDLGEERGFEPPGGRVVPAVTQSRRPRSSSSARRSGRARRRTPRAASSPRSAPRWRPRGSVAGRRRAPGRR